MEKIYHVAPKNHTGSISQINYKENTMNIRNSFYLVEAGQVTPAAQDTPFNGVDNVLVFARTAFEAAVIAKAYGDGKTLVCNVAADDGQTVAALSASDSMIATWIQYGLAADLLKLVADEGCIQVTADVYLQTRENLQAAQEDWGPEDKAADSDFSVARFWVTTDSGDEPVPVEDKEDSELLALVAENLEEITNIIKWYKSGASVNTNRPNLRPASLI